MKTLKNLLLTFFVIQFSLISLNAQVENVLKMSVPELYGELKITPDSKYDKSKKDAYRNLYARLNKAYDDVKTVEMELGPVTQVLNYDLLKSYKKDVKALDSLKVIINDYKKQINDFMKWTERYAADSINVGLYYTGYQDNFKGNNYAEAYKNWLILFNDYPLISNSIYTGGLTLLEDKIDKAKDSVTKQIYIDSVFILFDQQMRAYPQQKAAVKGLIALKYHNYYIQGKDLNNKQVREKLVINYNQCMDAVNEGGNETKHYVFPIAMKLVLWENAIDSVNYPKDLIVDNYLKFSDILALQYENEIDAKKKDAVKKSLDLVDNIFAKSDVSTCDNLVKIFQKKFDADPANVNNLKKILSLLSKKGCIGAQLYEDVAIALFKLEPSAKSAQSLGQLLAYKEKYNDAAAYYEEALKLETVDSVKARYYFEAAKVYNQLNQYSKAREYCRNALQLNPKDGKPYILIATMYASSANSVGADAFAHQCVFWAAVDKLIQAKTVDPSCTEDAEKLISQYSSRFPSKEEGFMQGVLEGQSYSVGGWIGEVTTARYYR